MLQEDDLTQELSDNFDDLSSVGLRSAGLHSAGLSSVGQSSVGQSSGDRSSVGLSSVGQSSVDRSSVDRSSVGLSRARLTSDDNRDNNLGCAFFFTISAVRFFLKKNSAVPQGDNLAAELSDDCPTYSVLVGQLLIIDY